MHSTKLRPNHFGTWSQIWIKLSWISSPGQEIPFALTLWSIS